jgi:glycosyltransferase involved in cell wall biosynthesis
MLNILYLGPYKQYDGIGHSAKRYIDAISSDININLSIRPLILSSNIDLQANEISNYIEFEENSSETYDMLIQHGYPEYFEYNSKFGKNIAIIEVETCNIKHANWIDKLNLLDEVWVGSSISRDTLRVAGVTRPIKVIPQPYNTERYNKNLYDDFFYFKENQARPYVFYTIGQYEDKNNIQAIIKAYLMEFSNIDNTKLFIKTNVYGMEDNDIEQLINYDMRKIYNCLRIDREHIVEPHIVVGAFTPEDIKRMHSSSNCYVSASRGECFGASTVEANLFGNVSIIADSTGQIDYVNKYNGFITKSYPTTVFTDTYYSQQTRTIHESWYDIDINELRKNMRKAYELSDIDVSAKNNKFNRNLFDHKQFSRYLK